MNIGDISVGDEILWDFKVPGVDNTSPYWCVVSEISRRSVTLTVKKDQECNHRFGSGKKSMLEHLLGLKSGVSVPLYRLHSARDFRSKNQAKWSQMDLGRKLCAIAKASSEKLGLEEKDVKDFLEGHLGLDF